MRKTGWLHTGLAVTGMMTLAGCGQRDAVDTVGNWYHQYQGGAIAQQRPPAPGAHDPYPHVGLTPTDAVDLPSPQARQALTDRLVMQRNYGQRLAVADGSLAIETPPPPPRPKTTGDTDGSGSSMSVVAAGQDDGQSGRGQSGQGQSRPDQNGQGSGGGRAPGGNAASGGADASVVAQQGTQDRTQDTALPAVTRFTPPPIKPGELPQIPPLPPEAPGFPGFSIPRDASLPDPVRPAYDLSDPHGTLIRFGQASDQIQPGQDGAFGAALRGRGPHDPVYVRGFGEITSFRPSEQAAGLRLGLLRARVVAQSLILHGVPADSLRLSAAPLGRGARIDLKPY